MKKVVVISSSMRGGSNSEIMAARAIEGARDAGHEVTFLSLKEKDLHYCIGCLACQNTGKCVIRDDMDTMIDLVKEADVLIFATPVYYYSVSGSLKTFLDRCNPLYIADYKFREVYILTSSTEEGEEVYATAHACIQGWVDCFPKASVCGFVSGGGVTNPREVTFRKPILDEVYNLGKNI